MKKVVVPIKFITSWILLVISTGNACLAQEYQEGRIEMDEKEEIIHSISDSLRFYYVDENMGKEIGSLLIAQLEKGDYDKIILPSVFAQVVTKDLRSLNDDLHLYLTYTSTGGIPTESVNETSSNKGSETNFGFQEIKFIDRSIGYLKINHFSNWDYASGARKKVAEIMGIFKSCKALIVDLRDNKGGVPYISSFLASYFFDDQPVHLADFYTRYNNYRYGIYTEPNVPGYKYPDIPLFILVNSQSASAAEEFAFWLQNKKRATVIGQKTAGAGYGALNHRLSDRFTVSISSEEEIDPITKKGFQGTGVIPNIIVEDSLIYSTAIQLAKHGELTNLSNENDPLTKLNDILNTPKDDYVDQIEIYKEVILLNQQGLLSFDQINTLGHNYYDEPQKSTAILKAFTELYSFYPYPFVVYARVLEHTKAYDMALINYNKAILLAGLKGNPALEEYTSERDEFLNKYENELKK